MAGFATHPHWDHLLWHANFGAPPRYGTARCASAARDRLSVGVAHIVQSAGIPEGVLLDLLGLTDGLPVDMPRIPWAGPSVRIVEHQAHAAGHAVLLIEEPGVLLVGDMLSDILIPLLDFSRPDPVEDYLVALQLLETLAHEAAMFIPGHGSVANGEELHARIAQDRTYVHALRAADDISDPRLLAPNARDWLPAVHARQVQRLAETRAQD